MPTSTTSPLHHRLLAHDTITVLACGLPPAGVLSLVNDDLGAMVDAVAQGRRIYQNLQKAVA